MAASTTQAMGSLPSGLGICTTAPDIFYVPELVSRPHQSGGLEEGVFDELMFHDDIDCTYLSAYVWKEIPSRTSVLCRNVLEKKCEGKMCM